MRIDEILEKEEQERKRYEAETIVTAEGETIALLRALFDAVCCAEDWKAPWTAAVPHGLVGSVMRAVEFFHADTPELVGVEELTGRVVLRGRGYQAD